ncbi:Sister chromatid cohesion protein Dcc1 [Penicillium chermesinum]|uniref:Sister chromatid cohesion protein Dcc1 n=1 Tax=Penicillium chermesinum TaxID=63820 RepID=A0A9W9TWP9_9EURO|nr:Sister chromatid cohesion protein Dcc1 [Penicillium chermesinum]KAJ5246370.1 Sister chromatid cohesion protein Dcc1 [Penicillium chermesinum]
MVRAQIASASLVSRVVRRQFQDRNEHQASVPMATQDSRGILFTHTQPQQGFRLLEIPPELEALLTSKDPPVLELKSPSAALALAVKDPAAQEYVNLCTATQTYRIRQVQSSNSLHILRPSHGEISQADIKVVEEEAGESGALNLPDEAVTAIAKCGSTLELHMPPGGLSAIPFLEKSLRLYDPRGDDDGDVSMDEGVVTRVLLTRSMRGNEFVPIFLMSAAQCDEGWTELCAFVDGKTELSCWRPSARVRLRVWRRLTEGALLQGIDLEKQFLVGDLWKSVLDDDDSDPPFPRALLEAVVRKLCKADERPPLDDAMKWASFDKAECSRWVGETHLAATAPTVSSAIGRSEFLRAWKDCLPESWRDEAALSKLQNGIYQSPDPTTICFVEPSQRQASSETSTAKPAANANAKNTRNWHELLKNQKRQ